MGQKWVIIAISHSWPGKNKNHSILVHISGKVLFSGVFEMITFLRTGAWIWTEEIEMDENGI
jgi:hypothetical protein